MTNVCGRKIDVARRGERESSKLGKALYNNSQARVGGIHIHVQSLLIGELLRYLLTRYSCSFALALFLFCFWILNAS